MKIVRFTTPGLKFPDGFHWRIGFLEGEQVTDLTAVDPDTFGSVSSFLRLDEPLKVIAEVAKNAPVIQLRQVQLEAPIDTQEVWAAGVTYTRKVDGSARTTAAVCCDHVYQAERPELFLKSTPERTVGPEQPIRMREDSKQTVPEPELALVINYAGAIVGYTIGNDVTARDISSENPLYTPQAKLYRGSCALGPAILLADAVSDPRKLRIDMRIDRDQVRLFHGQVEVAQMKRSLEELAGWLAKENDFAAGAFLLTGTGLPVPENFALQHGDVVEIEIEPIGLLRNPVE